jgi:hypothetical protein
MSPEQTIALPHNHPVLWRLYFKVEQSDTLLVCCAIAEMHNMSGQDRRIRFTRLIVKDVIANIFPQLTSLFS